MEIVTLLTMLLIFGLVIAMEVPGMLKKKQWREIKVFSGLLVIGLALNILHRFLKVDFAIVTEWLVKVLS